MIKKSIGGYIELEGFLSTSQKQAYANGFMINGSMIIEVPVVNLSGMHDNGFAHISYYSVHRSEREVLFNAFNVFKILNFYPSFDDDKKVVFHTIHLEYGSIKKIEDKVQKSENLLEAEFFRRLERQN